MRGARKSSLVIFAALALLGMPALAPAASEGLDLSPDLVLLGANLLVFTLLIYPTQRWLLAPLVRILVEREQRTSGAMARAEATHAEAVQVRGEIERVLANARAEAQARRSAIMSEAEAEERRILEAARTETANTLAGVRSSVAEELADARRTLQTDAHSLSEEAAARVLGRAL